MDNLRRLSDSYKLRAEELRMIAEMDLCISTSKQLMSIAHSYDQMAECADAIARSYQKMRMNEERQGLGASISGMTSIFN
jgi:hypothetical protein